MSSDNRLGQSRSPAGSVSSYGTATSQTFLLPPTKSNEEVISKKEESVKDTPCSEASVPKPDGSTPNATAGLGGKKKWNKVKLGIKFTAKIKPKVEVAAKTEPDIEYLLVSFLPASLCFKEIFTTLSRFIEIDKTTNAGKGNPYDTVDNVRRLPQLKSEKTVHGSKVEKASILLDLNRPLIKASQVASATKKEQPPAGTDKQEDEEEEVEDKTLLVSMSFTTDSLYAPLCEAKSGNTPSESDMEHFKTFDRIFAFNPKVLVMRQRCFTDQPFEVKAWVKNFKWAFPQKPEDTFIKLDKEDMTYTNIFVAQCLHQDIKRRIAGRFPLSSKVIQLLPNGDWRLEHYDQM